jgi:hypothetical protein
MADQTDLHTAYAVTVVLACFALGGCRNDASLRAASAVAPNDQFVSISDAAVEVSRVSVNR